MPNGTLYREFVATFNSYISDDGQLGKLLLAGYLSSGHILLEGPPGVAKTSAVKIMGALLGRKTKRVQFTPDLMPSDIIGYMLPGKKDADGDFALRFLPGPIFSDIFIADEINRAPARTQSALLEAMEERQVTVDGSEHKLDRRFWVLATQNPREMEGTYPLPEAEIDRFALVLRVGYLDVAAETMLAGKYIKRELPIDVNSISPFAGKDELIKQWESDFGALVYSQELIDYAVSMVRATRDDSMLRYCASPRALFHLLTIAGASAVFDGRQYVDFDDIKTIAVNVLAHRIRPVESYGFEFETSKENILRILDSVPVPR